MCSRGHLLRASLPHLQRARKKTSQGAGAHTVCARCVHGVLAAGRRARLACLPVCQSHLMSMKAMLHRPADLRATCEQNAWHELCAKAGGMATTVNGYVRWPLHWEPGWHPGIRGRPAGPLLTYF